MRRRLFAILSVFGVFLSLLAFPSPASAGPAPVLTTYVPIPEDDINAALVAMADTSGLAIGNQIQTTISITVSTANAVVYYDHWEDGFESDIANSTQSSTEVWGDNDPSNGIPPGYTTDVFASGSVIILDNGGTIPTPRTAAAQAYDGRDKVASNRGFALTRAGWEGAYGTLHAGAVAAFDTSKFGSAFSFPVGVNLSSNEAFEYTALSVMASQDGTTVWIDTNGDGSVDSTSSIDEGETVFINGGISAGGTLTSDGPVQAFLITGDIGATFEGRWYELFPDALLSDSYIAAAGTTEVGTEPAIFLNNPSTTAITVDITLSTGSASIAIPAGSTVAYLMPNGSGGRFSSPGNKFHALSATGGLSAANSSENDWGYTLVPDSLLTTGVLVGWGPGATDNSNMSPVWVAATADTTVYVDYDGVVGNDTAIVVTAYESIAVYDTADSDMTGARIYTLDGTTITAAWGQDPATASPGTPALDLGTAIIPATAMVVEKTASLLIDADSNGVMSPGDTVEFQIYVLDASALSLNSVNVIDDLPAELIYVQGSTTLDGSAIADDASGTPFPLDGAGHVVTAIGAGASVTFAFATQILDPWPAFKTSVSNQAIAIATEAAGSDSITIPVFTPALAVNKTADTTGPVSPGDVINYQIEVSNTGNTPQLNVAINDTLPASVTLDSASLTSLVDGSTGFALDDLSAATFNVNAGSLNWDAAWAEVDNNGAGAAAGDVRVAPFGGEDRLALRNSGTSATRNLDTSSFDQLTLSLDVSRQGLDNTADYVALQISDDGGSSWVELQRFTGPATDSAFAPFSYDVSRFSGGTLSVRLNSSSSLGNDDNVYFDNIRVDALERTSVTVAAGIEPNLASGLTLYPGETATVDIAATVNTTASGSTPISNTATATSDSDGPDSSTVAVPVSLGSIGDTVFSDINGNGIQDAGDLGLFGVGVTLSDFEGIPLESVFTGPSGSYLFSSLVDGEYTVSIDLRSLPLSINTPTIERDAALDGSTTIDLGVGEDVDDADFGYQPLGSIGDTVFADDDGDGTQGSGEPGIALVDVELVQGGSVLGTQTTNSSGTYVFDDLPAGTYTVRIVGSTLPASTLTATVDRDTTADGNTVVDLGPTEDVTDADFGYQPLGGIGDTVFSDVNGNGTQDAGEPGIGGVNVQLISTGGTVLQTDTTNASGVYGFSDLVSDDYTVRVVLGTLPTTSQTQTFDPDSTVDHETTVTLAAGITLDSADFGYQPLGSIGDTVFADVDGNGAQDIGDTGIENVSIELLSGGTVVATTTTNASGVYGFSGLAAGPYTVRVASGLPTDTTSQTGDRDSTLDGQTNVILTPGGSILDADFGYQPLGSIGDTVFSDVDGDGLQGSGEPGIAGVLVELVEGGLVTATATTDAAGNYAFGGLPAGTYLVRIASGLPANMTTQTADLDAVLDGQTLLTLGAAEVNLDADFGYQPLGSIGDTVFADVNGDGTQDAGDDGIESVTVQLLDGGGLLVATTSTDAAGVYSFTGLAGGTYTVRVLGTSLPLTTTTQTADRDGSLDGQTVVALPAGVAITDADFGYQPLGSIGDTVYADANGNGTQNSGEPGISGVTVELMQASVVIDSVVTDALGAYEFADLVSDSYTVRIAVATLPATVVTATGDRDGVLDAETLIGLLPAEAVVDADFGFQPLGSIGDTVFADIDGNGTQDTGDLGIADVMIDLLDGASVIATTVTNSFGTYSFGNLPAGAYTVDVDESTLPLNTTSQTADPDSVLNSETEVVLAPSGAVDTADFGYQPLGSIGDTVFADINGDGSQDSGDLGIAGVDVDLFDGTSLVASTTTDASGVYSFPGLPAGSYTVDVDESTLPATTTTATADRDGVLNSETTIALLPGETVSDADFGYQPLGSIGDTVFADINGDGTQDTGDLGIAGVDVDLFDGTTLVASTTTDASGVYGFVGLPAGSYTVDVDESTLPATTTSQTADPDSVLNGEADVVLAAGELVDTADFGYQPLGSIGDTVFADIDGNGTQDTGDLGIAGVDVDLFDGTTLVASTTTDASGAYGFDDLPAGSYTVDVDRSTLPLNTTSQTADPDSVLNGETDVVLAAGELVDTADFGYQPLGSIGDTVFADIDGNGTQDTGDLGIAGVDVDLLDGSGLSVASTTTDGSGLYLFEDVPAGTYTVQIDGHSLPITVSTPTVDRDGVLDSETAITLTPGQDVIDADFGYQPLGSIGDTVFADVNGDGTQDLGDLGIAGVDVDLLDGLGAAVASTTTDASGIYGFADLPAGSYTVQIDASTLPVSTTTQTADPDSVLNSETSLVLNPGQDLDTADFGYQPLGTIGDTVFTDINGDGTQDTGDAGIAGVLVELVQGVTVTSTATTDAFGGYVFGGLPAGTYVVRIASGLPLNTTTQTADPDGTVDDQTTIVLTAAGVNLDADFGYQPLGSIGDTVFADIDGNGTQDLGDLGIAGVDVDLLDDLGAAVASTTTDVTGTYNFAGLPGGSYTVQIDASTLPITTTSQSADPDSVLNGETDVVLTPGQDVDTADFGYQPLGSIGDTVFADMNGDGTQDAGDAGIPGVLVELVEGGIATSTATTDASGVYTFGGVPAGTYVVRIASGLPANMTSQTADPDATVDGETTVVLAAGELVVTADFGYQPLGTIGDTIFMDIDGNGSQDSGDLGIAGVDIDLLDDLGAAVASTTTDASGIYSFSGLEAGSYTVAVDETTLPVNTTSQSADPDSVLNGETDVVLAAGELVDTADFGYQPLGSIGDTVFADVNGDGTQDLGDLGIAGVDVDLLDGLGAAVASTTTDASGVYGFADLPAGSYTVQIDGHSLPITVSTPTVDRDGVLDSETAITLTPGQDVIDADFGYQPLGSIGDTVFADVNGDGTQDTGDLGVAGVDVDLLDGTGLSIASTSTDSSGVYGFAGLPAGSYTVQIDASTLPVTTTTQTADPDSVLNGETTVALLPGETVSDADFGYQPLGTIGDTVFADINGDGTQDAGDAGISGVLVELVQGGIAISTATTDLSGGYVFNGLSAGTYVVRIASGLPLNTTTQTADPDATNDGQTTVVLAAAGVDLDADFGYQPLGSIGDTVFADINGDGTQDAGDLGIAGVDVDLVDGLGAAVASTTTDASGVYGFADLPAGVYTAAVDETTLPLNTTSQSADPDSVLNGETDVVLSAGQDVVTADFGYQPLGTIGDTVFADVNGDGTQDTGDLGIAGVDVDLLDGLGAAVASTTTDASGVYDFAGLPAGSYTVQIDVSTLPATTTTATADRDGVLNSETTIALLPGETVSDADFGYQPLGVIGDTVFADVNGDGTQDSGDLGIAGVDIDLLDDLGALVASTTTDASGIYSFSGLEAGSYTVAVDETTLPVNTTSQSADPDSVLNGETDVVLAAGELVDTADFGYQPLGSIGDTVFSDINGNGVQDAGDLGIAGVDVDLLDGSGFSVASTTTSASGAYGFADVPAGSYTVQIDGHSLPVNATTVTADPDSILDGETDVVLAPGQDVDTADFGYQPLGSIGDTIFADVNGDGTQDAGDAGVSGVLVELVEGGITTSTGTTNAAGVYTFGGLPAGTYVVRIASGLPANMTSQTADPDATVDGETTVILTAGEDLDTADFGYQPLGTIGDTVFADIDGDGTQDAGDVGIAGVDVDLLDDLGVAVASTTTDASGVYGFVGLPAGSYTVTVDEATLPLNTTSQSADPDSTLNGETDVVLAAGELVDTADFGYQPLGSIGDTVFSDINGNGVQDAGDLGITGVDVDLLDGSGLSIASTTTDASGLYGFADVPAGSYTVQIDGHSLPITVSTPTADRDGVLDSETTIALLPGEDIIDADFGYQPLGTIGDTVFADVNGDGIQDASDAGIAGVDVDLVDGVGATVASTTTNSSGGYDFAGLPAGSYTVQIDVSTLPATTTTATADRDGVLNSETTIALLPGETVSDADFGYQPLGTIGDTVFADVNGDGIQDASDAGIAGVDVDLLDDLGATVASTTTDGSGVYGFAALLAGDYTVQVATATLPAGVSTPTGDLDGVLDSMTTITLASGQIVTNADFGYQSLGSIGDTVFADLNGDGSQDPGDTGISGVVVELLDATGTSTLATTTTDGSGIYGFAGLPAADYIVRVDGSTLPLTTTTQTADPDASIDAQTSVSLAPAQIVTNADFGYQPLGSIGDTVFADMNGDGVQDAGDAGISGVTVELTVGGIVTTTTTDGAGNYQFASLPAGSYSIQVVPASLPTNTLSQTFDRDGSLDDQTVIVLSGGASVDDADFGYQPLGSLGDTVFADIDGDGIQDPAEIGLPGIGVNLLDNSGAVIATTTTNGAGVYGFSDLGVGSYTVQVNTSTLPTNTTSLTADPDASLDSQTAVTLGAGVNYVDADFGYQPLGSIGDFIFEDQNGDGIQDAVDRGLDSVTIELIDGTGATIAAQTTDITGFYEFNGLQPDTYTIVIASISLPASVNVPTADRDGALDNTTTIILGSAQVVTDADFGYQPLGGIGDRIWADNDGDGLQDATEPGLAAVTVNLLDNAGLQIATTTTNANGDYFFGGLAVGDYTVEVLTSTLPANTTHNTADPDGGADSTSSVTLGASESITDQDFGYQPLGSIGDTVFGDISGNGIQDAGDTGIAGVTVELLDGGGAVLATEVTDASGVYSFADLAAGSYSVRVDGSALPSNTTTNTADPDGTMDSTTAVSLLPGQVYVTADFGFQPLGTIGSVVWTDLDGNGTQDTGEAGIPGITVELVDPTGSVVATTTTSPSGTFLFSDLPAGDYTVRVDPATLPTNLRTQTGDLDSILDDETDLTLPAGGALTTPAFGYEPRGVIGDLIFIDVAGDGGQDAGDTGIPGVSIDLLDNTGAVVASTVTDGSGIYNFGGLVAGDYTVRVNTATLPSSTATLTADPDGVQDSETDVSLAPGDIVTDADFGYRPDPTVGNVIVSVFADHNGDGTQNVADPDLSGILVNLLDGTGAAIASGTTGVDGSVSFLGLTPGAFTTQVDPSTLPADIRTQTADPDGLVDHSHDVTVTAGTTEGSSIYGYQPRGSISAIVFADVDGNGVQNGSDVVLPGITVQLRDSAGTVLATQVTDGSGSYVFTDLASADYSVRVVESSLPANTRRQTADPDATLDSDTSRSLGVAEHAGPLVFGYQPLGSVAGLVFGDANSDGVLTTGEATFTGVAVDLVDVSGAVLASTITDASGGYSFGDLLDGDYTVRVDTSTLPVAMVVQTADPDASMDSETLVSVTAADSTTGYDFGYRAIVPPALGSISSGVWIDLDGDGQPEDGEDPISGVVVELVDSSGAVVATATTGTDGLFTFTGLVADDYVIRVDESTVPMPNQTGDPDSVLDSEHTYTLGAGEDAVVEPFGYQPDDPDIAELSGLVFVDANRNSIRDPGEVAVEGATVILYDDSGVEVARTTTDVDGIYVFSGLAFGSYEAELIMPEGYTLSPENSAPDGSDFDPNRRFEVVLSPSVQGEIGFAGIQQINQPTTTTTTAPTTTTTAPATTTTAPQSTGGLAVTGANSGSLALVGVAMILGGGVAVGGARRRRSAE